MRDVKVGDHDNTESFWRLDFLGWVHISVVVLRVQYPRTCHSPEQLSTAPDVMHHICWALSGNVNWYTY